MEVPYKECNILVVDDTPKNLTILRQMLSQDGYRVRPAISGDVALRTVEATLPDLVLLDIMMPGMDGFEVCRRLKSNERTRDIPVVFLSALDDMENKVKAFQMGGVDYITKPFHVEEVLARVRIHLSLRFIQKQLEMKNARLMEEIAQRKQIEANLEKANRQLARLANLDGLTHVPNRRYLDQTLDKEWQRLRRENSPLAVIMCDIDYFKKFNDTYGHQAGDDCLRKVAKAVTLTLKRPADTVGRYGGEEFLVILPNTDVEGAMEVAQRIRNNIRELKIDHKGSEVSPYVSLSMGIAGKVPMPGMLPGELVAAADAALYKAKENGRDQIYIDDQEWEPYGGDEVD